MARLLPWFWGFGAQVRFLHIERYPQRVSPRFAFVRITILYIKELCHQTLQPLEEPKACSRPVQRRADPNYRGVHYQYKKS